MLQVFVFPTMFWLLTLAVCSRIRLLVEQARVCLQLRRAPPARPPPSGQRRMQLKHANTELEAARDKSLEALCVAALAAGRLEACVRVRVTVAAGG